MCRHITMGKKKNDFEASDIGMKKEARLNRVSLTVDMAWLIHEKGMPCGNWRDVHLPASAWRLSHRWVSIPLMPARDPE
jgi:hypothetical protein